MFLHYLEQIPGPESDTRLILAQRRELLRAEAKYLQQELRVEVAVCVPQVNLFQTTVQGVQISDGQRFQTLQREEVVVCKRQDVYLLLLIHKHRYRVQGVR